MIPWLSLGVALASEGYQEPPQAIVDALDAPRPPAIQLSPDRSMILELTRPELMSIAELAAPRLRIAGLQLDPNTRGPAGASGFTAAVLRPVGRADRVRRAPVQLPEGARLSQIKWSFDGRHVALTNTVEDGIELWVIEVDSGRSRRLVGPRLNATYGSPCGWLADSTALVCKVVPADQGPIPERSPVPTGPRIAESAGRAAPARTYTNLLVDDHDVAVFEHVLTSEIVRVDLDGTVTPLLPPALYDDVKPSPDGAWLLVQRLVPPWSTSVPIRRFPKHIEVVAIDGSARAPIADLPLADDVPVPFGSVRTGRRTVSWRADAPATRARGGRLGACCCGGCSASTAWPARRAERSWCCAPMCGRRRR